MKRPTALDVKAPASDDCFAHFDAVFDSLATELAWSGETTPGAPPAPAPMALVSSTPAPVAATADAAAFAQLEEAFNLLDSQLAGASLTVGRVASRTATAVAPRVEGPSLSRAEAPAPSRVEGPVLSLVSSPARKTGAPKASQQLMKVSGADHAARQLPGGVSSLGKLLALLEHFSVIQRRFAAAGGREWIAEADNRETVSAAFADVRQLCLDLDLQTARVRADFAIASLAGDHLDRLPGEIDELVRHLRHDLQACAVYPIAASRTWSFDLRFTDEISAAFHSAQADIAEAGQCLALGRWTASVFHLVRAAERGVIALGAAADAKRTLPRDDRKWDAVIAALESRLAEIDKWPAGETRARATAFFHEALGDVRALKDTASRLAGGQSARAFGEHDALSVLHRTRDFLGRLAERITEAHGRTLGKRDFSR